MRVAPRGNLTITLLRRQSLGEDRLLGLGPQPTRPAAPTPDRQADRVDLIHPGPQVRGAELLGYIFDQPGVLYPMPVGPTYAGPSPEKATDREHDRHDQKPCEASPEPAPNRLPEPADSGGGSLINVYA